MKKIEINLTEVWIWLLTLVLRRHFLPFVGVKVINETVKHGDWLVSESRQKHSLIQVSVMCSIQQPRLYIFIITAYIKGNN